MRPGITIPLSTIGAVGLLSLAVTAQAPPGNRVGELQKWPVHDAQELTGPTVHKARPPSKAHDDKLPIGLQDHSHPVRFRNIWVRDL